MVGIELALQGKAALVSGGNRGIGRAIALALASAGAEVAVLGRDLAACERVAAEIAALGRRGLPLRCDVTRADEVPRAVDQALDRFGGLQILVNSAGASPYDKPLLEMAEAEWDEVIAANLKGPFLLCRAAGPALLAQEGSSVINIASIAAHTPIPGESAYSAAKAGLVSLTRSLAQEWSPSGVRVNAIAPGLVRTEINRAIWGPLEQHLDATGRARVPDERAREPTVARALAVYERTVRRTPLGRYGTPEEVAGLAVFLASDFASFITGTVFFVDGGWQVAR